VLVVLSLLTASGGCGAARTGPPAQEAAGPAEPVAESQLSEPHFVIVSPGLSDAKSHPWWLDERFVRYGRGYLLHQVYRQNEEAFGRCPLPRDEGCASFSIVTSRPSPDDDAWQYDFSKASSETITNHGPFVTSHDWVTFEGGRDAVYALRRGGGAIDRIDAQGKVTRLAQADAIPAWTELMVFEMPGRTFVAGTVDPRHPSWELVGPFDAQGAPLPSLSRALMPMAPMVRKWNSLPSARLEVSAQSAREAAERNGMALLGKAHAVSLPDEGEKQPWALVWLETVPPPFSWPLGKAYRTPARASKALHGCGIDDASRPLEDRSVEKRAHITRFEGTRVVGDSIAWAANLLEPLSFLVSFRVEKGAIVVTPPRPPPVLFKPSPLPRPLFDEEKPRKRPQSVFPDESLLAAAFDEDAGEGLVVLRDSHQRVLWRRFDAEGMLLEDLSPYDHPFSGEIDGVWRVGSRWFGLGRNTLIPLTDNRAPSVRTGPRPLAIYPEKDHFILLTIDGVNLRQQPVDGELNPVGEATLVAPLPREVRLDRFVVQRLKGEPPLVALTGKSDSPDVAWIQLKPGASWTTTPIAGDPQKTLPVFRHVHGDLVVAREQEPPTSLFWLRAGQSAQHEGSLLTRRPAAERAVDEVHGPLLGGAWRIPRRPGPPRHEAALGELEGCSFVLPTGPSTIVLACEERNEVDHPGIRVALRLLRHSP
jgi:hypothetical protein